MPKQLGLHLIAGFVLFILYFAANVGIDRMFGDPIDLPRTAFRAFSFSLVLTALQMWRWRSRA
jgi:hypothetical protein